MSALDDAIENYAVDHIHSATAARAELAQLRARKTCAGCGTSKLDAALAIMGGAQACCPDCTTLRLDERNAIRARVAELVSEKLADAIIGDFTAAETPRTCATCRWLEKEGFMGEASCENPKTPNVLFCTTVKPSEFSCIHHAPLPPAAK